MSTGGADKSGSGGGGAGGPVKTPSDFLKSIRGRPVVVKLNSGVDYRGEVGVTIDQEHRPSRSSLDVIGRRREGAAVSAEQQGHSAGKTWEQAAAVG
uniref:LSM domain-containing protein n=1 Tax=Triticum urartu TaxID=4572 RepID=A0A8R7TI47_TRIUA